MSVLSFVNRTNLRHVRSKRARSQSGNYSSPFMKTLRDESKKKIVVFSEILDCPLKHEFLQKYDVHLYKNENDLVDANAFYLNQGAGHLNANKEFIDKLGPNFLILANLGTGYDHIDTVHAASKGIWVSNTPNVVAGATADLTLAHLLNISRRFSESERWLRQERSTNWNHCGHSLTGKTLGLIGFGAIGKETARRAIQAFGMTVIYFQRNRLPLSDELKHSVRYATFDELIATSDFISLHVPNTKETTGMINADVISKMKVSIEFWMMERSNGVVNTSRGKNICEQALADALKSGKVAGAGLDVFEDEPNINPDLLTISNVSLTPHIGTATIETRIQMTELALKNIEAVLNGNVPVTPVNYIPRSSNTEGYASPTKKSRSL